ncbi:hypothetical protein [Endozoicomonas sp. Mp262]|uniref:hypothetical protein n=1 Tax=Endozoicomonas sp. Mp262 TaxID=2919499 RepID=UPI0021DAE2C2
MPTYSEDALVQMLMDYASDADHEIMMKMLEAADQSLTTGANQFVDYASKALQPSDIKDYIRCYPLAHILIGITQFRKLNKGIDIKELLAAIPVTSIKSLQQQGLQ